MKKIKLFKEFINEDKKVKNFFNGKLKNEELSKILFDRGDQNLALLLDDIIDFKKNYNSIKRNHLEDLYHFAIGQKEDDLAKSIEEYFNK